MTGINKKFLAAILVFISLFLALTFILFWQGFVQIKIGRTVIYRPVFESATLPLIIEKTSPGAKKITVEADEYTFFPADIRLKEGETIDILFHNSGKIPHNFSIADVAATRTIPPDAFDMIRIEAPRKNHPFTFFCSEPGHREAGMSGEIIAE